MPIVHRHIIAKNMARNDGSPAPENTWGFVCARLGVNGDGGERLLGEEHRSTDWPTKALCEERLAQHEREHRDGTPVEPAPDLLFRHGYAQDGAGGVRKLTQAEILKQVGITTKAEKE